MPFYMIENEQPLFVWNFARFPKADNMVDLFIYGKISKATKDDLFTVTYQIPIVKPKKYTRFAKISVPTADGDTIQPFEDENTSD